ncbi:hypothetical protein CGLAU_06870 [Corynebacterium glaucum]|uniref:Bacterial sensory transduction regulator n=1 Tax=Corynebacterium glaucum TaxID=187491 RepID=A0A1Q2HWU7_9CORY|nr:YbjN domain-containing protein [Corynebacterium glaucum]AQQ15336.1 hypothetical protein CGLAU_06870 [Corynebacterium glaucum]
MSTEQEAPNVVEPVTAESVAAIFTEENLEHRIEGDVVRSGFVNAAIVVAVDGSTLVFETLWRGMAPKELANHLLLAVNEHNQTRFAPTLRMLEGQGEQLAVSAIRSFDIAHGASFNQLGAFIVNSIEATLQAFNFLENSFPTLVTWKDPHSEH